MNSAQAKEAKRQQRSDNIRQAVGHPERCEAERKLGSFEEVRHVQNQVGNTKPLVRSLFVERYVYSVDSQATLQKTDEQTADEERCSTTEPKLSAGHK